MNDLFDLTGKVALITGGSRGLGREMALAFARAGADVIITSRKVDACRAVAAEIEALGRRALAHGCHFGRWAEIDALVEAAYAGFGRVDILVNNAALMAQLRPWASTSTAPTTAAAPSSPALTARTGRGAIAGPTSRAGRGQ